MTLNAKIEGFVDFLGDFGLRHKTISFTRWCHGTIVMRSRQRIWYVYINLAWTPKFSAKLLTWNCYRLSCISWALAQISCSSQFWRPRLSPSTHNAAKVLDWKKWKRPETDNSVLYKPICRKRLFGSVLNIWGRFNFLENQKLKFSSDSAPL